MLPLILTKSTFRENQKTRRTIGLLGIFFKHVSFVVTLVYHQLGSFQWRLTLFIWTQNVYIAVLQVPETEICKKYIFMLIPLTKICHDIKICSCHWSNSFAIRNSWLANCCIHEMQAARHWERKYPWILLNSYLIRFAESIVHWFESRVPNIID